MNNEEGRHAAAMRRWQPPAPRDWNAEFLAIMTHLDAFGPAEIEYWRVEFDNADEA